MLRRVTVLMASVAGGMLMLELILPPSSRWGLKVFGSVLRVGEAVAERGDAQVHEHDAAVDDVVEVEVGEVLEGALTGFYLSPEPRQRLERLEGLDEQVEVRFEARVNQVLRELVSEVVSVIVNVV